MIVENPQKSNILSANTNRGDVSMTTQEVDPYETIEEFTDEQITQIHRLVQQQWWGGNRTLEEVRRMAENTSLMIGLIEKSSGELVGFCRVLSDFVFRATIYDVMVAQRLQVSGLGKRLMDTLCEHRKTQRVSLIYLACEPELYDFYSRWGVEPYHGRTQWMLKTQRAE